MSRIGMTATQPQPQGSNQQPKQPTEQQKPANAASQDESRLSTEEVARKETAARRDRATQLIGKRVSEGWTMLGQTCPICDTVLIRSKQQEIFCCSCNMMCKSEAKPKTGAAVSASTSTDSSSSVRQSAPLASLSDAPGFAALSAQLLQANKPATAPKPATVTASPPLGSSTSSAKATAAAQPRDYSQAEIDAFEAEDDDDESFVPMSDEEMSRRLARTNAASAELGRRMLSGWTMLATTCFSQRHASCSCPLMQLRTNSTRPAICVGCGTKYKDKTPGQDGELVILEEGPESVPAPLVAAPQSAAPRSKSGAVTVKDETPNNKSSRNSSCSDDSQDSFVNVTPPSVAAAAAAASPPSVKSESAVAKVAPLASNAADDTKYDSSQSSSSAPSRVYKNKFTPSFALPTASSIESDRVASLLGAKMLAGFTMLADECTNAQCSCPLVRQGATGDKLCVQCGQITQSGSITVIAAGATTAAKPAEPSAVAEAKPLALKPILKNATVSSAESDFFPSFRDLMSVKAQARKAANALATTAQATSSRPSGRFTAPLLEEDASSIKTHSDSANTSIKLHQSWSARLNKIENKLATANANANKIAQQHTSHHSAHSRPHPVDVAAQQAAREVGEDASQQPITVFDQYRATQEQLVHTLTLKMLRCNEWLLQSDSPDEWTRVCSVLETLQTNVDGIIRSLNN